ncbi:hypothetical protein QM847_00820 [Streptococcus timonensis]|uniref:hypothetical protein n=1 Tax=Streptococcus TaxID=1301 RepID=UPI0022B7BCD5|nr:hypothetical protein [Streptococcus sp. SM5]
MVECKVTIVEAFDLNQFPDWCKAILTDANGVEHAFVDKLPVFGFEEVEVRSLPVEKVIAFGVVRDLGIIVEIDTSVPHGFETEDGKSRFLVRKKIPSKF